MSMGNRRCLDAGCHHLGWGALDLPNSPRSLQGPRTTSEFERGALRSRSSGAGIRPAGCRGLKGHVTGGAAPRLSRKPRSPLPTSPGSDRQQQHPRSCPPPARAPPQPTHRPGSLRALLPWRRGGFATQTASRSPRFPAQTLSSTPRPPCRVPAARPGPYPRPPCRAAADWPSATTG